MSEPLTELQDFSPESRIWIFSFREPLDTGALEGVRQELKSFVSTWKAHGHDVHGGVSLPYSHFAVFCADPKRCDISGCSIDGMFRAASAAAASVGASLVEADYVFFRSGEEIHCLSRAEFKELAKAGKVSLETMVFDNTVQTLKDFRERWETKAALSWHQKLLPAR